MNVKQFIASRLLSFRYSGAKYTCPLCSSKLSAFLRLPDYYFEQWSKHQFIHSVFAAETLNVLQYSCPMCGSNDRDRLYALYLKNALAALDPSRKYRFIDFGPSAPLSKFLAQYPQLEYRTADLFMENVDDRVDIMHMDAYADKSADLFLCSHILEHVVNDRKALKELHRILKPGGTGIVMSPIFLTLTRVYEDPAMTGEAERWKHFGQDDHVRVYSKQGFVKRLKEAGFTVSQYGAKYFGQTTLERNGISPHSVLYVVSR